MPARRWLMRLRPVGVEQAHALARYCLHLALIPGRIAAVEPGDASPSPDLEAYRETRIVTLSRRRSDRDDGRQRQDHPTKGAHCSLLRATLISAHFPATPADSEPLFNGQETLLLALPHGHPHARRARTARAL